MSRSLNLTVTSPAQSFTEPVTLTEAKKRLNLPERSPIDGNEDSMIQGFMATAREIAEICQGRDFVTKQWDLTLDSFEGYNHPFPATTALGGYVQPNTAIDLLDGLVSVDLVRYRDSDGTYHTLTEDIDYVVATKSRPGLIVPAYGKYWPFFTAWPVEAVLVRFTVTPRADFTVDYKNRIKTGILYLISHFYNVGLPFEMGSRQGMNEYAWTVSALFEHGSIPRVHAG